MGSLPHPATAFDTGCSRTEERSAFTVMGADGMRRPVQGAGASDDHAPQTISRPFVRLNVDAVQNAAALRYQTW